jgi:hypothetical protein
MLQTQPALLEIIINRSIHPKTLVREAVVAEAKKRGECIETNILCSISRRPMDVIYGGAI